MAMQVIRQMIKEDHPDKAWAHTAWGSLLLQEKPDEAIYHYSKAIEIDPKLKTTYNNLGWLHFQNDNFQDAIVAFEKARSIESSFGLNNGIAQSYVRLGEIELAEEAFQRNITEFPDVLWGYGNFAGFIINHHKDTLRATKLFEQARTSVAEDADYFISLAAHHILTGKSDSALVHLDRALDFDPKSVATLQAISQVHRREKNHLLTEKYLQLYIHELSTQDYDEGMLQSALNQLAMNDYHQEKYDSALVHARQAIDINPNADYPYTTLAETHAYMGEEDLFYLNLEKATDRGFDLARYQNEEPYDRFKDQERFKKLLTKKMKN